MYCCTTGYEERPRNNNMGNYIVAANKSWHKELYDAKSPGFPGQWTYVDDHRLLTPALVAEKSPRYIFFLIGAKWFLKLC